MLNGQAALRPMPMQLQRGYPALALIQTELHSVEEPSPLPGDEPGTPLLVMANSESVAELM